MGRPRNALHRHQLEKPIPSWYRSMSKEHDPWETSEGVGRIWTTGRSAGRHEIRVKKLKPRLFRKLITQFDMVSRWSHSVYRIFNIAFFTLKMIVGRWIPGVPRYPLTFTIPYPPKTRYVSQQTNSYAEFLLTWSVAPLEYWMRSRPLPSSVIVVP